MGMGLNNLMGFSKIDSIGSIRAILEEQGRLGIDDRRQLRRDIDLASKIFQIPFDMNMLQDYYYWDNTTLSLVLPLQFYAHARPRVLEIGPGPAATLSRYIKKAFISHRVTCAEVDIKFAESAIRSANIQGVEIVVLLSNMTEKINDKFDLVFMNPPYVTQSNLSKLEIKPGTSEYQAGFGGEQGADCLLYTSPSPRDRTRSRMPSSA